MHMRVGICPFMVDPGRGRFLVVLISLRVGVGETIYGGWVGLAAPDVWCVGGMG